MRPPFGKRDEAKPREVDSTETRSADSWRLYFGRTPGGIPAVRVVKKTDDLSRQTDKGKENQVK